MMANFNLTSSFFVFLDLLTSLPQTPPLVSRTLPSTFGRFLFLLRLLLVVSCSLLSPLYLGGGECVTDTFHCVVSIIVALVLCTTVRIMI